MIIKKETAIQMTELMIKDGDMKRAKAFLALEMGHRRAHEAAQKKVKN